MRDITFGRLQDLSPREAWAHEAHAFTPWLAENIDQLAEVIGITLELTGKEVPVGTYAADILARNAQDDTIVLIENQLEATDHTHLGQIMTYLAGLSAQTVVWIAPRFNEPHLSAIRWLNQHTADGFSFFAVRLRVVRIGDSPYAPIFEVVERPNDWDRQLRTEVEAVESELSRRRAAFWSAYLDRHPDAANRGLKVSCHSNVWLPSPPEGTRVGLWLATNSCGIYVRGSFGVRVEDLLGKFAPHQQALEARLGVPLTGDSLSNWLLISKLDIPLSDEARWPQIIDWMEERSQLYFATLSDIFEQPALERQI
jgi:hypothetical protein